MVLSDSMVGLELLSIVDLATVYQLDLSELRAAWEECATLVAKLYSS